MTKPDDGRRYGQPHDFMNLQKRCRCGLAKIDFYSLRPYQQYLMAVCPVPAVPKK